MYWYDLSKKRHYLNVRYDVDLINVVITHQLTYFFNGLYIIFLIYMEK